jgi:predicted GNAT family acetyltransferase
MADRLITTYQDAGAFLQKTQALLEAREAANSLMLGICLRLKESPETAQHTPYLATVEDGQGVAVAAVMTPPHKVVLYSDRPACEEAFERLAQGLTEGGWAVPGVLGPSRIAESFAGVWARVSGQRYRAGIRQRIYELKRVDHPQYSPGRLRVAEEADVDLVAEWAFAFQQEALGEGSVEEARQLAERRMKAKEIFLWEDGRPVSVAARARPTPRGITVSLVYTPPEFRRRGYATSCVAALSQRLLDSGRQFCALFTDLSNPTSNSIYQKVGYVPVCDFNEYVFSE